MLFQHGTNVVRHWIPVQVLDQQFFCPACKVRCPGNLDPIFVIVAFFSRLFSEQVGVVSTLVQPLMVTFHLRLEPLDVHAQQRVVVKARRRSRGGRHGAHNHTVATLYHPSG